MTTTTVTTTITNNGVNHVLVSEAGDIIAEYPTLQAACADTLDLGYGPTSKILAPGEKWAVTSQRHTPTATEAATEAAFLEAMFAANAKLGDISGEEYSKVD